jgi:hypothetical protein
MLYEPISASQGLEGMIPAYQKRCRAIVASETAYDKTNPSFRWSCLVMLGLARIQIALVAGQQRLKIVGVEEHPSSRGKPKSSDLCER